MDIHVTVNRESVTLPQGTTVAQLLESRGIRSRASVWLNGTQLLLAEYADSMLQNGDAVKILRIVAGG